jgi:GNAT superfamily N-acetyltransferase
MGDEERGGRVETMSAAVETAVGWFTVARARPDDAETVANLLEEAAAWLHARGIDQWHMGDWLRPLLAARIAQGEVHLARHEGEPAATLTLQWSDGETWGPMPDDAGYIHGFAVRRAYAGQGLGRALLAWAERQVADTGRSFLRLDCMARNLALRAYYERVGFVERRDIPTDDWSALYEKRVRPHISEKEIVVTPYGSLSIARAEPHDLDDLLVIDASAYGWRAAMGIPTGPPPGPLPERFAASIARGEMYLARLDGVPAAKIVLQRQDALWEDTAGEAIYVRGLATHRDFAGKGVGLALLAWAERVAAAEGGPSIRLDCDADNPGIRAYYERAGFAHRGDVRLPHRTASRYEKRLGPAGG